MKRAQRHAPKCFSVRMPASQLIEIRGGNSRVALKQIPRNGRVAAYAGAQSHSSEKIFQQPLRTCVRGERAREKSAGGTNELCLTRRRVARGCEAQTR